MLTQFSFSLPSTNPTAVQIQSILPTGLEPSPTTQPFLTVATAGAVAYKGAPPLPDISGLNQNNFPQWDKPPPISSDLVQGWLTKIANGPIVVPNIAPFNIGGCQNNTARVGNTTECWWTCGGCTRTTDITTCPKPLTWGLSSDDGPAPYTSYYIDYLASQNLHATLFVVGSRVIEYSQALQNEHMAGHQIAVHTWSHTPLTTQTTEEVVAELAWSIEAIKSVIGVTPIYMRPPYGDIDDRVRAISLAMGLTPIIWTRTQQGLSFDTFDWHVPGGEDSASGAVAQFETILQTAVTELTTGFIVLSHDLWYQEVELSTGYFIPAALAQKFNIEPIYKCLGLTINDCYLETNNNATNPVPGSPGSPIGNPAGGSGGQAAGATAFFDRDAVLSLVAPLLAGLVGLVGLF